jgi:hypothetical protein
MITSYPEDTMPKTTLPWRTLTPPGPCGRLDPVLVEKTILELKAKRERREARLKLERRRARQSRAR